MFHPTMFLFIHVVNGKLYIYILYIIIKLQGRCNISVSIILKIRLSKNALRCVGVVNMPRGISQADFVTKFIILCVYSRVQGENSFSLFSFQAC